MSRVLVFRSFALTALVGITVAVMPASGADSPRGVDHDRARAARARGDVVPLAQILSVVERDFHGRVIEVEFEKEDGRPIYEIELLLPDGRVIELEFDARSGELIKLEGTRLETVFKPRPNSSPARR